MSDESFTWIWRLATLTVLSVLAWLLRSMWQTMKERIEGLATRFSEHEAEDRLRFDNILGGLGELKGKVDMLIGEIRGHER